MLMSAAVAEMVDDRTEEAIKVRKWRFEELERMGFVEELASLLADSTHEIRRIEKMLKQGATHDQVRRILL